MKIKKGFTLVELVVTLTIVSIMASAFVSLFVPQMMLFLFVPLENKVQIAATDTVVTMVEGDRFARGLKYAEPDTIAKKIFILPQDWDTPPNFTGSILYADPVRVRYGYHDLNRVFHTVELRLNTGNNTLERQIDAAAFTVISNGGSPGTGGLQIFTGDTNGDGLAAVFRYYKKDANLSYGQPSLPDPEMTGFTDSIIPNENLAQIIQVNIAFRVNTGGSAVASGQSETLKRSGARVRTYIHPESNEWDLSFYDHPGEIAARLLAVKKNASDIWVCSLRGEDYFGGSSGGFAVTINLAGRGDNHTYLMADCGNSSGRIPDGTPDLVEFKKNMTNTARTIVMNIYDGNGLGTTTTPMLTTTLNAVLIDAYEQYTFQMADYDPLGANGLELFVIQKGATTRVRIFSAGSNYATELRNVLIAPTSTNSTWKFLVTNWNYIVDPNNPLPGQDSFPDVVAIRQKGAASARVEVSVYAGKISTNTTPFNTPLIVDAVSLNNVRTANGVMNLNNVDFGVGEWPNYNPDGHPVIMYIQRNQTDTGAAEFHAMSNYDENGIRKPTSTTTIFDVLMGDFGIGLERDIGSGKSVQ